MLKLSKKEVERRERQRQEETKRELEKVKKRRLVRSCCCCHCCLCGRGWDFHILTRLCALCNKPSVVQEREREKEAREEEMALLQRMKEAELFKEWESQEDEVGRDD